MTGLPVGQSWPQQRYRRFGITELECPDAIRGLLGVRKTLAAPPCNVGEPHSFQRLEIAPQRSSRSNPVRRPAPRPERDCVGGAPAGFIWWRACTSMMFILTSLMCGLTQVAGILRSGPWCSTLAASCSIGNPRHLYRKLFADRAEMEWFPLRGLSPAWHASTTGVSRPRHRAPSSLFGIPNSPS